MPCTVRQRAVYGLPKNVETFGMLESLNDALSECVKACGGSKAVGIALWPTKGVEAAQRQLLACLNAERSEKFSHDEILHLMRMGRDAGCHEPMRFLAATLSYAPPVPLMPRDETDELQRQFIQATRQLEKLAEKIHGMRPTLRSAA